MKFSHISLDITSLEFEFCPPLNSLCLCYIKTQLDWEKVILLAELDPEEAGFIIIRTTTMNEG